MPPVTALGVDLAWGGRASTGLALVEDGCVVDSALRTTDEELGRWLGERTGGPCVVGIDAPIVVRNATGQRPCEARLNRCFARYEAGAHPANTALVSPRAERLAQDLGLDLDPHPASSAPRRALEVYPHPATVVLFGLDRTLKYKAGAGRTIASRHAAFTRYLDGLRSLAIAQVPLDVTTAPRWPELAETVTTSTVGAELDRAEDELDAYLCAYVALLHAQAGGRATRVVGDAATGAIVVPVNATAAACLDAPG